MSIDVKILMISESQSSHLKLREALLNFTLINFDTGKSHHSTIDIDSLFEMNDAEKCIKKSILKKINYHVLIVEINQFDLQILHQIQKIQKIDQALFIIIASESSQNWPEISYFLGQEEQLLFFSLPFDSQEFVKIIQNIFYIQQLKFSLNSYFSPQLQLSHSQQFKGEQEKIVLAAPEFEEKLNQVLSQGYVERFNTALVFINIDSTTLVKGEAAEYVTEYLLKMIKIRLQHSLKEDWILGQWAPESFGIIIPQLANQKVCEKQLLSLHDKLTELYKIYDRKLIASVSIGVGFSYGNVTAASELKVQAKSAVKATRSPSKRQIAFYNSQVTQKKNHRLMLETELKKAIQVDQFEVHFQPIINIQQKRVSGIEILVRWRHPTLGLLLPYKFLTLAQEGNLLTAMNELVISKVLATAKIWLNYNIKIAFNLPVEHLLQEVFIESMNLLCQKHAISPHCIELEVTEEQALGDSKEVKEIIEKIKYYGYHVVLDDFGVGYSSLQYLAHFPIDKIKIDRSFLNISSPKQNDIIKSILQLCHKHNIRSLCEGVEDYEQYAFLAAAGCEEIQGFFFSRPLSEELIEPYLRDFSMEKFLISA